MRELEINGYKETIIERSDYPIKLCKEILNEEITAILGYGPQGYGQGLNMRDQGFNVILGLRKGNSWEKHCRTVGLKMKIYLKLKKQHIGEQ